MCSELQDGMKERWPIAVIGQLVQDYVTKHKIEAVRKAGV